MERMLLGMLFVWIWCMVSFSVSTAAMVPAPAPQVDCNSELAVLVPCLSFVQGTDKAPSSECCTGLKSVLKSSPVCLCQLVDSGAASSAGINTTLALELPSKCNIKGLNPNQCSALLPGSPTPAISPSPSSGLNPEEPPSSSSEFFEPVPAPESGGSGAGGVPGSPNSSPPPAPSSASSFSPLLWIYVSVMTLCAFL